MAFIRSRRGLDLNLGIEAPTQADHEVVGGDIAGVDLTPFASLPLKVLVEEGQVVHVGDPLVKERDKEGGSSQLQVVSHLSGCVKEVRRGLKRQPLSILIEKCDQGKERALSPVDASDARRVLERLTSLGLFSRIRQRPFDTPARPDALPRAIFIKAVDKAPGAIGYEKLATSNEGLFNAGLKALNAIAPDQVHLVSAESSTCPLFKSHPDAHCHSVEGPYPTCCPSFHIARISPIRSASDRIWTLDVGALIAIGRGVSEGGVGGLEEVVVYGNGSAKRLICTAGTLIGDLVDADSTDRIICGNLLTGHERSKLDPLPFGCQTIFLIPEDHERQMLHFMRLKTEGKTATRTFIKGKKSKLSTNQNGERRPFVDGAIYDQFTPLDIPTMPLIKAIMAEDFEKCEALGLLDVASEDFALATFVCPSKIEMVDIVDAGLKNYCTNHL